MPLPRSRRFAQTYFEPAGESWRVSEPLRRQARWEVADLAEETARGPWDVILWRNLAIYLNPGPAEALWRRLTAALAPAGFLIVGKAERAPAGLGLAPVCRSVYRKATCPDSRHTDCSRKRNRRMSCPGSQDRLGLSPWALSLSCWLCAWVAVPS